MEGIYEGKSQKKELVKIRPDIHGKLNLEILPIVKHDSPLRIPIGEVISLRLDLISSKAPQQIRVYYTIYDRDGNESGQNNQEMRLWNKQPTSSTWIYKVGLPAQKYPSSIKYYIGVEYESHLTFRQPETQYSHYQISIVDDKSPTISLLYPPEGAQFGANQQITIRAKVTDNIAVKEVHVHFSSDHSQKLTEKGSSGIYTIDIPVSNIVVLRYYLTATDEEGNANRSELRQIEIKPVYQGIWVSAADNSSFLDWEGNKMFRLAYLREGKTQPTLGAQLDFSHPDRTNVSAMVQWGSPDLGKSNIAFTLLGGIAEYEDSPRSTHITPLLGAGLKFYPRDKIVIDATSSIKFRSDFDTINLYHYEAGIRFYITRQLSLRTGYGKLYLGKQNITTMQIGFGYTF